MNVFPSVEFTMADFVGVIILCTAQDLIGSSIGWGLKPC